MAIRQKFFKGSADPIYVNITGDTMTGPLILSRAPELNLEAATKAYSDAQDASVLQEAKEYADALAMGENPAASGSVRWYASMGAPAVSVGQNDDLYLDALTGEIYHKVSGTWALLGRLLSAEDKAKLDDLQGMIERTAFFFAVVL